MGLKSGRRNPSIAYRTYVTWRNFWIGSPTFDRRSACQLACRYSALHYRRGHESRPRRAAISESTCMLFQWNCRSQSQNYILITVFWNKRWCWWWNRSELASFRASFQLELNDCGPVTSLAYKSCARITRHVRPIGLKSLKNLRARQMIWRGSLFTYYLDTPPGVGGSIPKSSDLSLTTRNCSDLSPMP